MNKKKKKPERNIGEEVMKSSDFVSTRGLMIVRSVVKRFGGGVGTCGPECEALSGFYLI